MERLVVELGVCGDAWAEAERLNAADTRASSVATEVEWRQPAVFDKAASSFEPRPPSLKSRAALRILWSSAPPSAPQPLGAFGDSSANDVLLCSPDGGRVIGGGTYLKVWGAQALDLQRRLEGHEPGRAIHALAWHAGRGLVASASGDRTIRIWAPESGSCVLTLRGHLGGVTSVAFDPRGQRVASASEDESLRVWDVDTGQSSVLDGKYLDPLDLHPYPERDCVAFLPDGRSLIARRGDGVLERWNIASGRCEAKTEKKEPRAQRLALLPDGIHAVTGHTDGSLRLWKVDAWRLVGIAESPVGPPEPGQHHDAREILSLVPLPDGRRVATGDAGGAVRVWDVARNKPLGVI